MLYNIENKYLKLISDIYLQQEKYQFQNGLS